MVVENYGSKYTDSQWKQINKKAAEALKAAEAAKITSKNYLT